MGWELVQLRQKPLIGFFLNPFGLLPKAFELQGDVLRIVRRGRTTKMSMESILEVPKVHIGAFGATLTVDSNEFGQISLRGANALAASHFARALESEWTSFNTAAFEKAAGVFDSVHSAIFELKEPTRYPAACTLASVLGDAAALGHKLIKGVPVFVWG